MKTNNQRKKEALLANKHLQNQNANVKTRDLTKDLYLTAVSTILCIFLGVGLFFLLA